MGKFLCEILAIKGTFKNKGFFYPLSKTHSSMASIRVSVR